MTKQFDFKVFNSKIQKDLSDAENVMRELETYYWANFGNSKKNIYTEDYDFNTDRLADIYELIQLKIEFAYEYLELPVLAAKFSAELKKYAGSYGILSFNSYIDIFYSPVRWILIRHLNALTVHVKVDDSEFENTNSYNLLEQLLRGTPKMLTDRKIEPANETEVRDAVYNSLIHVFPDTVKDLSINKVSKVYKPDIGIKSLKSAIEYKFVDSLQEAKKAIGGIFEDIKGYTGSKDWTTFYAIIYMTDHFMTQAQVEAEFKLSKVSRQWKPILVFGRGQRNRNRISQKSPTAPIKASNKK